jgi:phasin
MIDAIWISGIQAGCDGVVHKGVVHKAGSLTGSGRCRAAWSANASNAARPRTRIMLMSEVSQAPTPKAKPKAAAPAASMFEFPKFEMPTFEVPHMEVPAAFREFAEKSVSQAKDTYERMKSAAEEATDVLEGTYATATKGVSDYGLKMIEAARVNTNATFDFCTQFMTVKSYSELVELSTAHARKQFEAMTAQTKDLAALAQKVMTETAEPVKDSMTKVFKKVG